MTTPKQKVQQRPAESASGLGAAVVVLIAYVFHINDANVLSALILVVGFLPALITWIVHTARTA